MCALGLGWPSLWVPQRRPQTSQRGDPKEDPPKGQKSRDQIKTQSSSKDPWGNLNLPGTGWLQRSFPALRILWVNLLCPPFYSLRVSVQISSLLAQQHLEKGFLLPHLHCTLSIIQAAENLDELEQKTTAPVTGNDFCAFCERQVPLTEKWRWVWFGIQEAIPAARSPRSEELADK